MGIEDLFLIKLGLYSILTGTNILVSSKSNRLKKGGTKSNKLDILKTQKLR